MRCPGRWSTSDLRNRSTRGFTRSIRCPGARVGVRYVALLARRSGRYLPLPRRCDLQAADAIARWLPDRRGDDRALVVNTVASSAVRIAASAMAIGKPLTGVVFHCRSEPLTEPRRRIIKEAGARALPAYGAGELPSIAYACPAGAAADDVHLASDRHAAILRERAIGDDGTTVRAILLSTLSPHAPKVALNAELGDTARLEERDGGCSMGSLGLRVHLSEVRSFVKLSSEGTTFVRSTVLRILEEVLPARFGGTAVDYQLAEEAGADGATRLVLRVHPGIGAIDEHAVRSTLLEHLGSGGIVDEHQARLIRRAGPIEVRRLPPLVTRAGKVLPLRLLT